jgi:hypothetical protein
MRMTYRTRRVLSTIAAKPGASNRDVADAAGIEDQGQISKLLAKLAGLGLLLNANEGRPRGGANAWWLTEPGEELERTARLAGTEAKAG